MKKVKLVFVAIIMIANYTLTAQVAVNTDGSSADASAMMDVKSSAKGMLIPRMTQAEIEAITNPAVGLSVFNTDDNRFYFYDGFAAEWKEVAIGAGTITPGGGGSGPGTVTNPTTGDTWSDSNLGASQVATSSTDAAAYGDTYQWGRAADGHESRSSGTTSTNATTAVPNGGNSWDGLFIIEGSNPYDWLTTQDNTLWNGTSGTNNPCPSGFRLPTDAEWDAERLSWASNDGAGAFGSPLKLVVGGYRDHGPGSLGYVGTWGLYWSSSASSSSAACLFIKSNSSIFETFRANGLMVRCIKD